MFFSFGWCYPAFSLIFLPSLVSCQSSFQHTRRKVLSTVYRIHELTDAYHFLVFLGLTGERVYAPPVPKAQPILLSGLPAMGGCVVVRIRTRSLFSVAPLRSPKRHTRNIWAVEGYCGLQLGDAGVWTRDVLNVIVLTIRLFQFRTNWCSASENSWGGKKKGSK